MILKGLAAVVLLVLSSMLVVGHAMARTAYTPGDLAPAMLTASEINAALSVVGSSDSVTDSADGAPSSGAVVSVSRVFKTGSGLIAVALFGNADSSALTTEEQNGVLSGQYLQIFANGVFDSMSNFALSGSTGLADQDQLASFSGTLSGSSFNVVADSFIKGNVFAVVMYATPGQNDGTVLGGILGGQILKLS